MCSFLVSLCRAILDQVCRVHEMLPLWSRSSHWTVMNTVPGGKINLVRTQFALWEKECSSVAFEQNLAQGTLSALLVHSQSCRIKSTVEFQMNQVWACSNSPFCSEYSVPFWVCLSVVFSEIVALLCSFAVSGSVLVERFWIKIAFVFGEPCCSWMENKPGSYCFTLWENAVRLLSKLLSDQTLPGLCQTIAYNTKLWALLDTTLLLPLAKYDPIDQHPGLPPKSPAQERTSTGWTLHAEIGTCCLPGNLPNKETLSYWGSPQNRIWLLYFQNRRLCVM